MNKKDDDIKKEERKVIDITEENSSDKQIPDDNIREYNSINDRDFDAEIDMFIALIETKKYSIFRQELLKLNEVDIAEVVEMILERLGMEKALLVYRMLPKDVSVEVFAYLPVDDQVDIINGITQKEIDAIINELAFDDMIDVLEELPANVVDKILEKTTKEERKLINTFLNYPENCAGSLMTIDYIALRKDETVAEAMSHIKRVGLNSETIYTCFVKDTDRRLIGVISLRTLVIADDALTVGELMHKDLVYVNVLEDQEDVSQAFKRYGFISLPVVDNETRLVGIITVDDILDVIDEETTEDFQRMAGVISESNEYLEMSVFKHVKTRLPWLFLLMCSYVVTGSIITHFEGALSQVVCLVAYMPMLMGTGGNSGSQSATLIIRGLSTGDIELKDALRVFWKEIRISAMIGICLSAINFLRIVFLDHNGILVALAVCGSMLLIVMAAKTIGSMLPMIAKRVGIDPALMASPMISSLTDLISVITYFVLATQILGISF